jgi:hypothetical protein
MSGAPVGSAPSPFRQPKVAVACVVSFMGIAIARVVLMADYGAALAAAVTEPAAT